MLSLSSIAEIPKDFPPLAITIGKFDGLHLGHQQLLHELVEYAADAALVPAVLTFDRNPSEVISGEGNYTPLIGPTQKLKFLEEAGIELVVTLAFDQALASTSAEDFVNSYLVSAGAKMVFLGEGARFGFHAKGDISLLRELGSKLGFRAKEIRGVFFDGERISTTRIKNLLDQGHVEAASALLGRNHLTTGVVEHGRKLGRSIGFPTANLSRQSEGYLPADGIYAGWLHVGSERFLAAHSVGTNDSVAEVPRLVESHVIGRDDLDLYDKVVTVEYVRQVRPWAKFASLDQLVEQIGKDVQRAKELMANEQES